MNKESFGKVGVLMGGISSERDISLKSGQAIFNALEEEGVDVVAIDISSTESNIIKEELKSHGLDAAVIALHGQLGEDGGIQRILDELEILYAGCGVQASQVCFNKGTAQKLLKKGDISIPSFKIVKQGDDVDMYTADELFIPVVIKPVSEGSSIGVSIVKEKNGFQSALDLAWTYSDEVLIETFIAGREFTVGILGDEALPVIEIKPANEYFDFEAKYKKGMTDYVVPAVIDEAIAQKMKETALAVHQLLGCEDLSRVDFILDKNDVAYVLEINTVPGFTETSLLPKAAKKVGISFNQLCCLLLERAYAKKKEKKNTSCIN